MPHFRRLLTAAIGLALPLAMVAITPSNAQAATRHHRPARVITATYKPHHRHAPMMRTSTHHRMTRHHTALRGS